MNGFREVDTPPFILGVVADEFFMFMNSEYVDHPFYDTFGSAYLALVLMLDDDEVAMTALDFYGVNATHSLSGSYIVDYTQIVNDGILCAMDSLIANLPDPTGKYYYRMDTVNEEINEVFWTDQYPQCWNRACHGIDLVYSHRASALADNMDNETLTLSE